MANNKKTVILKDSYFQDGDPGFTINYSQAANYINAVLELQRLYNEKKIEVIHLGRYSNKEVDEAPIGIRTKTVEGELKTLFTTSHYIGCFSINGITFKIEPRFGNNPYVLNRLLSYACDVYIPQNSSGRDVSKNTNLWLLVILFRSLLKEAIAKGQIPKEYKTYSKNLRTYKGRLNISKHIHYNLTDCSKFYCIYKKIDYGYYY